MTEPVGSSDVPPGDPVPSSAGRIGVRDGGVSRRLTVRCRSAASVLAVAGAVLLLIGGIRTWGTVSAGAVVLAAAALLGAALLAVRARLWSRVGTSTVPATPGAHAVVGASRPLSPGVPGAPVKRRLGAAVVPIHRAGGPQPGGGALIVHARADAMTVVDGDEVSIWQVRSRGLLAPPSGLDPADETAAVTGRFVLVRADDGAIFLATSKLTDTW